MSLSASVNKPPLYDQITELQRKLQLQESERKALYERTEDTIKKSRESIQWLRQENKRLRKQLAEAKAGDQHVIKGAFNNRGSEKDAYRNMSGKEAIEMLDQKVLSKKKRLNALKHTTETYQHRLEELKMDYRKMTSESSSGAVSLDAHTMKKEEDAMKLRALENNLEKTQLKCKAAEKLMNDYLKLKHHLEDESLTFQGQLDSLEAEILKCRKELHSLQVTYKDAQLSKEAAKVELQQQEELLYKERKEREKIIASYRKNVEELKAHAEKVDKKVLRIAMQQDELSSEAQLSTTTVAGEEEKKIITFEEAFKRIKEATGVTKIQEIVERFNSQKEKQQQLLKMKNENEKVLQRLKEQKDLLSQEFVEVKYSGETKHSRDQQTLEECEQQLLTQQQRCDAAKERMDWLVKTLNTTRAGVEHLADKLHHISLSEDRVPEVHPDSDGFVLELISQCEKKLEKLHKELQGKDLAAIMKEMDEEEFVRIEGKLPEYNTRTKLTEDETHDPFDDEDERDEDEAHIISREALKRQSQLIIDSKSKRKPWNKKKKGKF